MAGSPKKATAKKAPSKQTTARTRTTTGRGEPSGSASNPPPDSGPASVFLSKRNGVRISAIRTNAPWDSADVLVVPVDSEGTLGVLGEQFRSLFGADFSLAVGYAIKEAGGVLSCDTALRLAFDTAGKGPATVIIATSDPPYEELPDDLPTPETAGRGAAAAVRLAARLRARRVTLPLLGTGAGDLDVVAVASATLRHVRTALRSLGRTSLEEVTVLARPDAQLAALQAAALELRPEQPSNDIPSGDDLLDVKVEAESLADMLLLRELEPPLAVGILGGWGTGKSFAMHLMRERMNEIRGASVDPDAAWPEPDDVDHAEQFVGHVYQIEFNAWTYAHSDLWSALMQTIFAELNRQLSLEHRLALRLKDKGRSLLDGGDIWKVLNAMPDDARNALLEQKGLLDIAANEPATADALWANLLKVRSEEQQKLHDLENARDELVIQVAEERQRIEADVDAELRLQGRQAAWVPVKRALADAFGTSEEELERWVLGAGRTGKAAGTVLPAVLRHFRLPARERIRRLTSERSRSLAALGLCIVATLALPVFTQAAATALPGLAAAVGFAVSLSRTLSKWQAVARQKAEEYEAAVAAETTRMAATRPTRVESAVRDSEIPTWERKLAATSAAVDQQRRVVGPTAEYVSVSDFVDARLKDGGYEKQLGLMRQVHLDLLHLTNGLTILSQDRNAEQKRALFPRGKPRVVLYIDDLDRCPPKRVVEVFEAIQLLLTTQLFVVVVAIDLRYVARALESVYGGILSRFGEPSGLDYIEKIIQIPYRTRPSRPKPCGASSPATCPRRRATRATNGNPRAR